jgi:hypothetical protein
MGRAPAITWRPELAFRVSVLAFIVLVSAAGAYASDERLGPFGSIDREEVVEAELLNLRTAG